MKGFVVVVSVSHSQFYKLKNVKFNVQYFQENAMDCMHNGNKPSSYRAKKRSVKIHMRKEYSNTVQSSITYISKEAATDIRVILIASYCFKSPETPTKSFCQISPFMRGIASQRLTIVVGLWKSCNQVWNNILLAQLRRSLLQ